MGSNNKITKEQTLKNIEVAKSLKSRGHSTKEICSIMGLHSNTIYKYLNGFVPTPYAFGVKISPSESYRYARAKALKTLGDKCTRCGISDYRVLQVDHVNGGGTRLGRLGQKGYALYIDVVRNPEKYQCLCANCNWIKKYENNEI